MQGADITAMTRRTPFNRRIPLMSARRSSFTVLLTAFGLLLTSCGKKSSTAPEDQTFTVTCSSSDPFCPSGSSALGFSGSSGAPTITPTTSTTTVTTSSSSRFVSGTTSSTTNGYWFIIIGEEMRAWGVLAVSSGFFDADVPLFCGTQQVGYSFAAGSARSYFRTSVTYSGCTAAQLRVQLSWDTGPDSDIDLHLLRPGGSVNTSNDCYYGNCQGGGLDWGVAGTAGNPILDVDDTQGYGPENIVIGSGAESGSFRIIVRNFDGTPNTKATVKVFLNEVEVQRWTSLNLDSGVRDYWQVGNVNVVSGTTTTIGTYSTSAPPGMIADAGMRLKELKEKK
jgi:hypothetical protein